MNAALALPPEPSRLVVLVEVRTDSEANRSRHEKWYVTKARVDKQHKAVMGALVRRSIGCPWQPPIVVTLARIAPGELDSDNHVSALKAVRDAVAKWIGIDDRHDDLVEWRYGEQQKAPRGRYGVRITIEPKPHACPTCKRPWT